MYRSVIKVNLYGGNEGITQPLLTSELSGRELLASRPSRFTPRKGPLHPFLVGPRAGLDAVKKLTISRLLGIEPWSSIP
jgi:hypothetical protein